MSEIHEKLTAEVEKYVAESDTFENRNVKAAAARARKALSNITKLAKSRRAEIQARKNSL